MDINVYENIKEYMKKYFDKLDISFKPNIVGFAPSNPTYPMIKFQEVRNVPFDNYRGALETVANLGYEVDVYAKTRGSVSKQLIARTLAKYCNDYLTRYVGCRQISWNEAENDGPNGDLYHIIITYSATYHEQKLNII